MLFRFEGRHSDQLWIYDRMKTLVPSFQDDLERIRKTKQPEYLDQLVQTVYLNIMVRIYTADYMCSLMTARGMAAAMTLAVWSNMAWSFLHTNSLGAKLILQYLRPTSRIVGSAIHYVQDCCARSKNSKSLTRTQKSKPPSSPFHLSL